MRWTVVFVVWLGLAGPTFGAPPVCATPPAGAGEPALPAAPRSAEQAADAVVAAVEAKDDAAIGTLAREEAPDPWVVADVLLARGARAAANVFAAAAARPGVERLAAYVA